MTPFDSIDKAILPYSPQKGRRVVYTRFVEVDNTAIGSGLWTGGITGISAIIAAPDNASVWMWLIGLIITGLFGVASSVAVVVAKYVLDEIKARHRARTEKEFKDSVKQRSLD